MKLRTIAPLLLAMALASSLPGCAKAPSPAPDAVADAIYVGGDIVTVNPAQPAAEALAVKAGRILAVGARTDVERAHKGTATRVVDLGGRTLVPGFIDTHSHFIASLTMADRANVSQPPVGPASNPQEIVATLREFATARDIEPGELIVGSGYDDSLMPRGQLLSRDLLDEAFPDNPVVVVHVSMHGAVLNSAAFAKYGFKDGMPTPDGGVIVRKPGTPKLQGLIMEAAYLPVFSQLPSTTPETEVEAARKGQLIYAAAGITTAQEGATHAPQVEQLQRIAQQDGLFIDVVAYPFITDIDKVLESNPASTWGRYDHRLKLGGCKITTDGSPQARTAWFTKPYLTGGPNGEKNWTGGAGLPEDLMLAGVRKCYDNGLQLNIHANGDAAIDFLLQAHVAAAGADPAKDRRTVAIHSQFIRADQLEKYREYRIVPALFTLHTFFFYDVHAVNRGPEQAAFISPMKTAFDLGMRPTNHTDYAVTPIDQMFTIWSAVNRVSRNGVPNGQSQRITPLQALEAITINAAYQYSEEASKGSLEPGKLADMVVLDANPLEVPPLAIRDIKVVETIKEGKTIWPEPASIDGRTAVTLLYPR
jgi:predicted amidohydrolase YtcJ